MPLDTSVAAPLTLRGPPCCSKNTRRETLVDIQLYSPRADLIIGIIAAVVVVVVVFLSAVEVESASEEIVFVFVIVFQVFNSMRKSGRV